MLTPTAVAVEASARDDAHAARSLILRAVDLARRGRIGAALETLAAAPSDPGGPGDGPGAPDLLQDLDRATALATTLECRLARGEIDEAIAAGSGLARYVDHPGRTGATAHHGSGGLAAATGRTEPAVSHFLAAGRLLHADADLDLIPWRTGAALGAVRLGRVRDAIRLATEHVELSRTSGSPYALAVGLRALAIVDSGANRVALLREAAAAASTVSADRLGAQVSTDLAGALLLGGTDADRAEALELLRAAERYAGREQLWPLQERVRRLLDVLGEPPCPTLGELLAGLTPAGRRVADLAASGLTNREIASRLLITPKAVEWHLSRIYRKLGVTARDGLVELYAG